MGPLARVWKALKNDPTLTLSLEEVATNMDATYHRQFNAVSSIIEY